LVKGRPEVKGTPIDCISFYKYNYLDTDIKETLS
jgi:hypothetical protein